MKTTRTYKLNKPDYSDPIDVEELTENFDVIDYALEATQIKKTRVSNTISEKCILPYYRIRNNNDFDVTVTDRNFSVDYVIEAGKGKRFDVDGTNTDMNFYVQGLHDVEFEWFVSVADAIAEGGGGGGTGGTKNYNELINQPKINGVTLTGDVALTTLGIKGAAGKDVDTTGTAVTSESTNVPTSAAVNAFVGSEIAKLGKPMEFKGKFSKAADVPDLSDTKEGWTYKVAVAGTYAGQKAKVGDVFISTGTAWEYLPSGDDEFSGENLLMTEYTKGSAKPESTDVSDTDTLNEAVQKIEWAIADKVDKDTTVNGKKLNANIVLSGNDEKLNATSYAKDEEVKDITKDSKIDEAVAQLEYRVDTKVNKTSVSSGENSTTSVINVTDAKAQMAMVAKISGKTVKSKNLFIVKDDETGVSKGVNYTISDGVVSVSGITEGNAVVQMLKEEIYISEPSIAYLTDSNLVNINCALSYFEKDSTTRKYLSVPQTNTAKASLPADITVISMYLQNNSTGEVVSGSCKPMIVKGSEKIPYEPYFEGLHSAPVESVVSQGKNLVYKSTNLFPNSLDNRISYDSSHANYSVIAKIKPNTQYTFTRYTEGSNRFRIAFFTDEPVVTGMTPTRAAVNASGNTTTITSGNSDNYVIVYLSDFKPIDCQIEEGSTSTEYSPYNKTTVLVPQSIRNLPDYGVDGNIVDFENGVYNHNYTISNGAVTAYTGTDKVIPITDYLRPLPVENGGTITLVNEHNLDMPSVIKYKKEV